MFKPSRHRSFRKPLAKLAGGVLLAGVGLAMIGAAYLGLTGKALADIAQNAPWQKSAILPSPVPTRFEQVYVPQAGNLVVTATVIARTPRASPTPQPIATPTIGTDLPHEYSDLLILSGGKLLRWDPVTRRISTVAERVADYSANASGKKVALLRSHNIAANGVEMFNLELLDLSSKQTTTILKNIPRLYGLSLSPDGKWIAYSNKKDSGLIQFRRLSAPDQVIEAGTCFPPLGQSCGPLVWSPNSQGLVWSDQQGLWYSSPFRPDDKQLAKPQMTITDPQGEASTLPVWISNLVWSPNNRFIFMDVSTAAGVNWLAVLDTTQGRLATIPDSLVKSGTSSAAMWMNNGALITTNVIPSEKGEAADLLIRQWQVVATRPDLLKLETTTRMATDLPAPAVTPTETTEFKTAWPYQFGRNRVYLVLLPPLKTAHPAVYLLDLRTSRAQKMVELPEEIEAVLWSPDGRGATILIPEQKIYYAPLDSAGPTEGASLVDLNEVLGAQATKLSWQPPAPHS